ncbi:hypothetical protein OVA03_06335 [Asticcacaulis sp. SL142]|uniref:hypothetical protein n=1 Tax=Asticcacaulis sp. SL142 TaxID=2995155 RepID=UPI00226D0B58|nr:hypothetical protein [Asticcacaulis sp. SL142]WAC49517.1 hypothetical protein OVA03_06335 [Asticcacaulis sp. SL142]
MTHKKDFDPVIQESRDDRIAYSRQWHIWLGLGSAGGAISMVSLSASLPNINVAIQFFLPSLWMFLFGVIFSAASLLALVRKARGAEIHYGTAKLLDENKMKLLQLMQINGGHINPDHPEFMILDAKIKNGDKIANKSWKTRNRWNFASTIFQSMSALLFVLGFLWPLSALSLGHVFPLN